MNKRIVAVFFSLVIVLSLVACNDSSSSRNTRDRRDRTRETTDEINREANDNRFFFSPQAIDADKFDGILYELGFYIYEGSVYDRMQDEVLYAYSDNVYATYLRYRNEDAAKKAYDEFLEDLRYDEEDEFFVGDINESGTGNFRKLVIDGEQEDYWGVASPIYYVVIHVDDIMISIAADSARTRDKEAVDDAVKALGY